MHRCTQSERQTAAVKEIWFERILVTSFAAALPPDLRHWTGDRCCKRRTVITCKCGAPSPNSTQQVFSQSSPAINMTKAASRLSQAEILCSSDKGSRNYAADVSCWEGGVRCGAAAVRATRSDKYRSSLIPKGRAAFWLPKPVAMAKPAGRLMSLLQNQSKDAKQAIMSHLAPAVAKGSVGCQPASRHDETRTKP